MDPFIEGEEWEDFHLLFVAELRRQLAGRLLPRYIVRGEEYVYLLREAGFERGRVRPDTFVVERSPARPGSGRTTGAVSVLEPPAMLPLPQIDWHRQVFLEVRRAGTGEIVCVIELLSPVNKQGAGREEYVRKRTALLQSTAHLVEIDLLRGGQRLPMDEPLPPGDFYVFVSRAEQRPMCGVCNFPLRERLPEIPVPLGAGDPDLVLDLQVVFDAVYDDATYGETLNYGRQPLPPLTAEDTAWTAERLAAAGQGPKERCK
jgi:hypothetical protein